MKHEIRIQPVRDLRNYNLILGYHLEMDGIGIASQGFLTIKGAEEFLQENATYIAAGYRQTLHGDWVLCRKTKEELEHEEAVRKFMFDSIS